MGWIATLSLALGASWVSGIRLYAVIATLGLLSRFAYLHLPGRLHILTNWWVIGVALGLYIVEFFADKIPYVDSVWDAVHTFIRIPAGAVLAAGAFGDFDPAVQVIAFLVGGGVAFASHSTKAVTRAAVNTSPEPFSNLAVSASEDVLALGTIGFAAYAPILLFLVVGVGFVVSLFLIPRAGRVLRQMLLRLRGGGQGIFKPAAEELSEIPEG